MGILKKAAALVNMELGLLPAEKGDLIVKAADELGAWATQVAPSIERLRADRSDLMSIAEGGTAVGGVDVGVAVGLAEGFDPFPLIDPRVIADITGNGEISGTAGGG